MQNIPSIEPILYQTPSIPEAIGAYITALEEDSSPDSLLALAKMQEVLSTIVDVEYLTEIRSIFDELYQKITVNFPDLCFVLEGRRKSLTSTVAKIDALLSRKRSLDLLRDIYAFRITLFDVSPDEHVETCYKITNALIPYFVKKGFIPCDAEPLSGTDKFVPDKHPHIIVPTLSLLEERYGYAVKDYIHYPKENGYQSLHVAFRDAIKGRCFEIQVRTHSMHVHAENGTADHELYKEKKYKTIKFDPNKVNMRGFLVAPSGAIHDAIGLANSVSVLVRQRTFLDEP